MTIQTITFKDGSTAVVEAPEGTPVDQLVDMVNAQANPEYADMLARRKQRGETNRTKMDALRAARPVVRGDDGTAFGRGISRGIDVTQQNLGSAVEGIGSILGLEGLETYGADVALANEAELQAAERYATRLKDVEGVGTGLSYTGEIAGESAPMMAGAMAGGAAGAAIGAGFGGVGAIPGAVIGAGLGAAASMFPLFYGGNRERQKEAIERGERTELSEGAAALTAIPQAALDAILTGLGAKFFVKPAAEIGGGLLTRAGKGAGVGAATEIPTEIGQVVLERLQAGLPVADAEAMREYGEAGVAAGLLGGGVGGVAGAARRPGVQEPEVDPNGLPEGIAGLLPPPSEAELRIPTTRQLQDSTSGETIPMPAPPKLLTGPDDLGIQLGKPTGTRTDLQQTRSQGGGGAPLDVVNYTGEPTESITRDQKTAARTEGMEVVERARAELQSTGEISSDTMQNLRTARVPFESVASVLQGTRYEPALDLIEGTDLPAGAAARDVKVQPIQDEARLAEVVRQTKQGGLGGLAAGRAMDAQAAEDAQIDQMIGEELTQDVSGTVRKAKATGIEQDIEARAAQELEGRVDQDLTDLVTEQEQLQAASEVETAQNKMDTDRIAQTEATRTKVLQNTVANAGEVRRPEALRNLYETALTNAGIANAKVTPTEMESLRRASGAMRAKAPVEDIPTETTFAPNTANEEQFVVPKGITPLNKPTVTNVDLSQPLEVKSNAKRTVPEASGVSPPGVGPSVADTGTGPPVGSAGESTALDGRSVGPDVPSDGVSGAGAAPSSDTLEASKARNKATAKRLVTAATAKPTEFNRDATPGARTEAGGQVIPGVARSKTTGKKLSADVEGKFAPKTPVGGKRETVKDQPAATKEVRASLKKRWEDTAPEVNKREYNASENIVKGDPFTLAENRKILKRLETPVKRAEKETLDAVVTYLGLYPNPAEGLRLAMVDMAMGTPQSRGDPLLKGTGGKAASKAVAWATENLDSNGKDWLRKTTIAIQADLNTVADANITIAQLKTSGVYDAVQVAREKAALEAQREEAAAAREAADAKDFDAEKQLNFTRIKVEKLLEANAVVGLDLPQAPSVTSAIKNGNLQGALEALAGTAPDAKVARIARKLAANVGNTKLVVKKNLKADDGRAVAGLFDPETNTIALDEETGISTHPLLHEMLHAVTSATIANKSHPLTKRLNTLFGGVKEQLAGEYGLTTLDEFVAEAMANPEFQTQLKTTVVDGKNPWQQMVRAVSNFVRRLLGLDTKSDTSTFDAVDDIVQAMIAPTYEGRAATKVYMQIKTPAGAGKLINGMAANVVNVVKEKGWYETARDWVGGATPLKAKSVFLDFMELRILSELASKKIPEALKLNDLVNNMSDNLKVENKRLLPIITDLTNLMAKNKKDFATLRFLLPNSSAERIDPRVKDFDKAYGRDKGDVDAVKLAKVIHKDLHAEWNSMGAEGKRLYSTVTNMFESRFDDAMDSIKENIRVVFGEDAAKTEATFKNLAEKLGIDRGRIRPYMPLGRDGNYRLEFNTLDPRTKRPEQFVEYYATAKLRNKAKDNIKAYEDKLRAELPKGDIGLKSLGQKPLEGMRDSTFNFDKAPQGSFVANVLNTLKADGVDSASINSIIELAIDSMPERSFMQAFRTRKDTRGFLGDVTPTGMAQEAFDLIDTVQSKGRDYNRQVVQMQFGAKIQALKNEINEKYKYDDIDESTSLFKKKLLKIADFAQAPNVSRLSQNITGAAYAWTMGLNLSSAATAVFDVPMSVYPRLAGKFGDKDAVYALGAAVRMLSNAPKESITETYGAEIDPATGKPIMVKRKINEGFAGYSNTNYDFDEIRAMSKADMDKAGMSQKERQEILDTEVLVEVGSRGAQYNSSLNHEHLDVTRGKDQANFLGLKINMETVNAFSSFLFHHSERYSREVTMQASYRLELNRLRDKPNNTEKKLSDLEKKYIAAEYAVSETQLSLGATASAGRPIMSQNAIGNVAMLFKRFAISKYYMMARMTDEAFKNAKTADEKAMRSMARGQLGRFMVTSATFAGVAGMPLMGAIGQIYDLIADEEDDNFDAVLLKTFGEPLSSGLINAALGVDMASRISMNSLLYRPPIIEKDQPAAYTLLEQLGGPAVGIYLSFDRGYDLFNEGEFVKGTEAILPAAFRNVIKGGKQLYTGDVKTRRGDAVIEDIGLAQILMQIGGFGNAELARQYTINRNERGKQEYLKTERTRLLRLANIAAAERDRDGYKAALKKIRQYNKDMPRSAERKMLIMPDTIAKSRTAFNQRTQKMIGGIEYTPFMQRSLREYERGLFGFN